MNPAFAGEAPYQVPSEHNGWRPLLLATAMHAVLFFFLWAGVHWQNTEPVAVEAEVWDLSTQAAAPPAPPPRPEPDEAPAPAPAPVELPPEPKPDIALEQRKAKLKADKEKAAKLATEKADEQKRQERDKLARIEQDKADKAAAQAKARALADAKAKAEAEADAKAEAKAKADKLAKAKKAADEQKAIDKMRQEDLNRMTRQLGASGNGNPDSTGTAAKSTAPRLDAGYVAAITSKIKSNIAYGNSTDVAGNPRAVFKIEQLPTGEIISVKKIRSSGVPAYDIAVENAIAKSSPLPKKKDGTVVRELEAEFNMKDLP